MEKIVVAGVEIQFNDLSEQSQEKLYFQEKEKFEMEVVKSQYANIRRLLIKDEKTSSNTLDEIFKVETEIYGNAQNIVALWNHPNFEKNDEKRKTLATSDSWEIRKIATEDEESSSKLLNEMYRNEIQGEYNEEIIEAILYNPNFQMEKETLKVLAKSEEWDDRLEAAKYDGEETSSEFLNEMYRNEIQGEHDEDVILAILNNTKFQMEKETLKVLAKSKKWEDRLEAAKYDGEETSSEFLNEMYRNEIQGEGNDDVEDAILNNLIFKMEEETWNILAKSPYWQDRIRAAKEESASSEQLQKMYLTETEEKVLKAIELNLSQKISKTSTTLNAIQKRQILNVLKELKHSKKKKPLSQYLEQILEIIG